MKNTFLTTFLSLCFIINIYAQKINVIEENSTIENKYAQGFSVVIDLDKSEVKKNWSKQLKSYGSLVKDGSKTTITTANVPSLPTGGSNVYSQTSESPNGLKIWLCIITPDKLNSSEKIISEMQAKNILKDFAATSYRDNINEQIKDAEKVLMTANKNQERVFRTNEKIKNQILDNATEKIELENKLKKNASDLIQLNKDLEQNKIDQQNAKQEVEEMKKVVDIVKNKLNEIN